ncbi:unnamed protein product [Blepharisma stoltei]|uniref:beta-ketoacyl-[acyl-carrier-protein] synthase I n=1 Tax=Blepharisma stoltei TaxID=1481888 RepID=A0AAU9JLP6_9CILI|nr:unnamed protein product [Blepharisma stoltei]
MSSLLPRRVVITGLGLVTPLGANVNDTFSNLLEKKSGLRMVTPKDLEFSDQLSVKTVGFLDSWDKEGWVKKVAVIKSVYHALGFNCATDALIDSAWSPKTEQEITRTGVMYGSPRTSSPDISIAQREVVKHGYIRLDRLILAKLIPSMIVGTISIPRHICGFANSFCSGNCTGAHAVGDTYRTIGVGDADIVIAGAAEHDHDAVVIDALTKGSYGYNLNADENPSAAVKPFDTHRNGWVYSIGGSALILEDLEHALNRGAKIYAEMAGYSMLSEAGTQTAREGNGIYRSMKRAIEQAGLNKDQIDAVFAGASGNFEWDEGEAAAILKLFGEKGPAVTSTKGGIGHMQGTSSALDLAIAALSMQRGVIPPITNLENPLSVQGKRPDFVTAAREKRIKAIVANSINYDGTGYCSVVLKAFEGR